MDDAILNIEGATELLGVSEKTMIKLLREEHIPARKIGREWRFSKQALVQWLSSGDSIDYANESEVISISKDAKGNFADLLEEVSRETLKLKEADSINAILEIDETIGVPGDVTMRATYKQVRDMEKLRFELFWPLRNEYKI